MDKLTLDQRPPQMGDRIKHQGIGRSFLCHVDADGLRLVCAEESSEPWLSGYMNPDRYPDWVYDSFAKGVVANG